MVNTQNLASNTSLLCAPSMFAIYFAPCALDMFNFRKSSTQNPNKRQKHPFYNASLYFATPPSERPISYTIIPAARAAAALQIPLMSNKCAGRWTSTSNIKLNKKYIGMLWKKNLHVCSHRVPINGFKLVPVGTHNDAIAVTYSVRDAAHICRAFNA